MNPRDALLKGQTTNSPMLAAEKVIWSAWNHMGDKEVAREAAAKGHHHLDLAIMFLSNRLKLPDLETRAWMVDEVLIWVLELLKRRQVYKASHILSNMGLDVSEEITKIFTQTSNKDLRDFLGNHLMSIAKVHENILHSWNLLNNILSTSSYSKEELHSLNINYIMKKSDDWKCKIGSELFFKTYDQSLDCFLKPKYMWASLLKLNKPNIIKFWINMQFSNDANFNTDLDLVTVDKLKDICKLHPITPNLINTISNNELCIPSTTQETVLNELSRFGIFCEIEETNVLCILRRLITTECIGKIDEIFARNHSSINIRDFNNLVSHYCIDKKLYTVLNSFCKENHVDCNLYDNELKLMIDFKKTAANFNDLDVLSSNIIRTFNYLYSKEFYSEPLILLSVFLLNRNHSLFDILVCKSAIQVNNVEITSSLVDNCINGFTCVKLVCNRLNNLLFKKLTLNVYDLLKTHAKVNTDDLYEFRFDDTKEMPHFKQSNLIEKYGYKKKVNYLFYLRQCRPCIASKMYLIDKIVNSTDDDERTVKKTYKLATRNFLNCDIGVSCIMFLELINVLSTTLRICLKVARTLHKHNCFLPKEIEDLFDNIQENAQVILNRFEDCSVQQFNEDIGDQSDISGPLLKKILKEYSVGNQFAKIYGLKLPEKLLARLAKLNMWLPLLLIVQQHDYGSDQVKKLIPNFQNLNYLEHINHSIVNDTIVDEQKEMLMKERDSRKSFLSRIGVRQRMDLHSSSSDGMSSSMSSTTSLGSGASLSSYNEAFESDPFDYKPNLLQIIIKCHNGSDPPKALLQACQHYKDPLLAILAASYEPDSVITNWLTWLTVSCNFTLCDESYLNCEILALNAKAVSEFMIIILKNGYYKNLLRSFQIFLPENPLKTILDFLVCCVELKYDAAYLKTSLELFKKQLHNTSSNCIVITTDHEMSYINNKVWIENQALIFISVILQYYTDSRYNQKKLIQLFCSIEMEKYFSVKFPKLKNVLLLLDYLDDPQIDLCIDLSVLYDSTLYKQNTLTYIDELIARNMYALALSLAKLEDISPDNILIQEWSHKLSQSKSNTFEFWDSCNKSFTSNNMLAHTAVNFYLDAAKNVNNSSEKYTILKHAYEYANKYSLPMMHEIERDMWITLLSIEDKNKKFESDLSMSAFFYTEMLDRLDSIKIKPCPLTNDLANKLEKAIDDMLCKNDIFRALKLEKLFDRKHPDLDIIKLMFSLSEKLMLPYQLSPEERLLVNKAKRNKNLSHRRNFLSRVSNISMSSYASGSTSVIYIPDNSVESPIDDTLATLDSLAQHVNNGVDIAQRILMLYRISVNIEKEYHEVVTIKEPMNMLKEALENDCRNKLEVVHDFISVYRWSKEQIAQFICSEIQSAAMKYASYNTDIVVLWDLNMTTDFHLVLQLLPDNCSILGSKLYAFANSLYKYQTESDENYDANTLSIIIELLIRAHSCFTTDCNMESITLVLKKCQMVISILVQLQHWRLMVKLLTGVGRYTEMNYVFQILKENEQFEYLLKEGVSKDSGLKVALLEYLRKYCPDNKELYRMVALHFALFSEVAVLWEKEADNYIKTLIEVAKLEMQNNKFNPEIEPFILFQSDESTRLTLNKAMVNYNHAAEYHLIGDKLAKALHAAKQAELIALQISLIPRKENSTVCILNLKNSELLQLITSKFSFPQARILVEAYNYHVDWSTVIFEQYIIRNQKDYINDFMAYLPLSDNLVHNISRKFLNNKAYSSSAANNMKNVLNLLSSIHVKYKLASELGFLDVVEEILEGNQLSYLKDTVWKRGYKDT